MRFLVPFLLLCFCGKAQDSLVKTIWFGPDSYELSPTVIAEIAGLKQKGISLSEGKRILVIGHTDNLNDSLSNMRLSEQRARAVADVLRNSGFSAESIHLGVFGANEPVGNNNSLSGRALNRRVEIKIGPALASGKKNTWLSYSTDGTIYNSDTISIDAGNGVVLRFPPGCIQQELTGQLRFRAFVNDSLIMALILNHYTSISTSDRVVDLQLLVQCINPTSVSATRTAFEILIPAGKQFEGMVWFEEEYYKQTKNWELIGRKSFPLIYNGTPYIGLLSSQLKSHALGANPEKEKIQFDEIVLSLNFRADSIILFYNSNDLRRIYRYMPDGNTITPERYICKQFSLAHKPGFYVYTTEKNQTRMYFAAGEKLIWSKRKNAWLLKKQDLIPMTN